MPHYHIHLTSSDGATDSPDPEGITLNGFGTVRALVTETLLDCAQERPGAGVVRTVTVTACDAHGAVVHRDEVVLRGPLPDAAMVGVWRAMAAMSGVRPNPRLG